MSFVILRAVFVTAAMAAASASCGSVSSPGGTSASPDASHSAQEGGPPLASVYLATNVGMDPSGGGSTSTCNVAGPLAPFFAIGTMGTPVANGQSSGEAAVTVDCAVRSDGDGFDVNIQVSQGETDAFSFNSTKPITDTPGAQTGVAMSVGKNPNTYTDSTDCTFTLSDAGNPSITAGRIWGTVVCPTATYAEVNATCYASATFILQNCSD
jgi:hypothetical protein